MLHDGDAPLDHSRAVERGGGGVAYGEHVGGAGRLPTLEPKIVSGTQLLAIIGQRAERQQQTWSSDVASTKIYALLAAAVGWQGATRGTKAWVWPCSAALLAKCGSLLHLPMHCHEM